MNYFILAITSEKGGDNGKGLEQLEVTWYFFCLVSHEKKFEYSCILHTQLPLRPDPI